MKFAGGAAVAVTAAGCPQPQEKPWDAIIIGSGLGGLGAASTLAQLAGMRCLILEQHWIPGGGFLARDGGPC